MVGSGPLPTTSLLPPLYNNEMNTPKGTVLGDEFPDEAPDRPDRVNVSVRFLTRDREVTGFEIEHGIVILPSLTSNGEKGFKIIAWGESGVLGDMIMGLLDRASDSGIVPSAFYEAMEKNPDADPEEVLNKVFEDFRS